MKLIAYFLLLAVLVNTGTSTAEELEVEMFRIRSADPESLRSIVGQLLTKEGKVTYDSRTNNLIVVDTRRNLEKIAKVIKQIDIKPKQVKIEVVIADVSETFTKNIGLGDARVVIPCGAEAVVSLIESRKDASIRSKSFVTTLSNYPARLQVTSDIILGAELIIYSSKSFIVIPAREPVGTILEVLPRVNKDNTITLYIQPSLSTLEECTKIPFKRALATQVVVSNGETIVIGGLCSQKKISGRSSISGVSTSRTLTEGSGEIVIFLTAEILE